jgi:hypothetical protein
MTMFDLGQKVLVITDKGVAFDAVIIARAKGESAGPGAYKVAAKDLGPETVGQWHKASDVFIPEQTAQEKKDTWNDFLKE